MKRLLFDSFAVQKTAFHYGVVVGRYKDYLPQLLSIVLSQNGRLLFQQVFTLVAHEAVTFEFFSSFFG